MQDAAVQYSIMQRRTMCPKRLFPVKQAAVVATHRDQLHHWNSVKSGPFAVVPVKSIPFAAVASLPMK
jgi:hypothetical protein